MPDVQPPRPPFPTDLAALRQRVKTRLWAALPHCPHLLEQVDTASAEALERTLSILIRSGDHA